MGKSAAEQIKNTKMVAHLLRKNLELVMALTLTERVLAAKIRMIKLALISTAVLIMTRIMIKVRALEIIEKQHYFEIILVALEIKNTPFHNFHVLKT